MACVSGLTNGNYYFIDCCGNPVNGTSLGNEVCLDYGYSSQAIGISNIGSPNSCTQNCGSNSLNYTFSITGICQNNTGKVIFTPYGGVPPYTIDPITPVGSGLSTITSASLITYTGLTGGTYVFRLNDSLAIQNNEIFINVLVTGCYIANIIDILNTTCGFDNGSLSVSTNINNPPYSLLLYKDNVLIFANTVYSLPYEFPNLPGGTYNAKLTDGGGVTANTENVLISPTTPLDFGFWQVNTSDCNIFGGKISVTGITGYGPYTYLWSNGEVTPTISGLSVGNYSCLVTDNYNGCSLSKSTTISTNDPLGISSLVAVEPSCFNSDGSLTFTISGASLPIYYSASTAQQGYTLSNVFTITGLSSGSMSVSVTDASQCNSVFGGFISVPNGFWNVSYISTNSNCNQNNGSIFVSIEGLAQTYTYQIVGQSTNVTYNYVTNELSHGFNSLPNDTYVLSIIGSGTNCVYVSNPPIVINSEDKFTINVVTTGSTCGLSNGIVDIIVNSGYTSPLDYIISNGTTILDTPMSSYTVTDLLPGSYTISVNDADGCQVSSNFMIINGTLLSTSIINTNCTSNGNNGTSKVNIYSGEPPFTYLWSNGQTGMTATNLSAGTYSVTITDDNGCTNIQNTEITCLGTIISGNQVNNICNTTFNTISQNKRGFSQMLNEGFYDATIGSGNTLSSPLHQNCIFSSATFTCEIEISGVSYSQTFYTATTINDYPQDSLWKSTIEDLLSTVPNIQSYDIDLILNTLKITAECGENVPSFSDVTFILNLTIDYVINCDT